MKREKGIIYIDFGKILIFLLVIFCFSTICANLVSFLPLNKLLAIPILAVLILFMLNYLNKWDVVLIGYLVVTALYTFFFANDRATNMNDLIYWEITILIYWKCGDKRIYKNLRNAFLESKKVLWNMAIVIDILLLVSLLNKSLYISTSSWGEGTFFVGYGKTPHSLASGCCLLLAIMLALQWNEKFSIIKFGLCLIPVYAILQTAARVFLIPMVIMFVMYYFKLNISKSIKIPVLIILGIGAIVAYMQTSAYSKMIATMNNPYLGSPLNALTSGRIGFWTYDIEAFFDFNVIKKLFGTGFDYVYHVNYTNIGMWIWAHNDVIDCLLSVGIVGTVIYIGIILKYVIDIGKIYKEEKRYLETIMFGIYILVPLLLNGLFQYQHLIYSSIFVGYFVKSSIDRSTNEK